MPGNVALHVGLFQDTLEPFLKANTEPAAFVHLDADIYSATIYVLRTLMREGRLVNGTILAFDELINVPEWKTGEFLAFAEFLAEYDFDLEWIAQVKPMELNVKADIGIDQQVAVRLLTKAPMHGVRRSLLLP